jgi:hypothetical protein
LFREARVIPFLKEKPNAKPDTNPVTKLGGLEQFQAFRKKAENLRKALQDLQSQF